MTVLYILIIIIAAVIYVLFGAHNISQAIEDFNKKRYFRFGMDIMGAIMFITFLIKLCVRM